jgi:hypothetical protein
LTAAVSLLFLDSMGFIKKTSADSVKFTLQNVISHYQYAHCRVPTSELLVLGTIFLNCLNVSIF